MQNHKMVIKFNISCSYSLWDQAYRTGVDTDQDYLHFLYSKVSSFTRSYYFALFAPESNNQTNLSIIYFMSFTKKYDLIESVASSGYIWQCNWKSNKHMYMVDKREAD